MTEVEYRENDSKIGDNSEILGNLPKIAQKLPETSFSLIYFKIKRFWRFRDFSDILIFLLKTGAPLEKANWIAKLNFQRIVIIK